VVCRRFPQRKDVDGEYNFICDIYQNKKEKNRKKIGYVHIKRISAHKRINSKYVKE